MIFLYIVKIHINERFKQKLPMPIPVELIVVDLISFFLLYNTIILNRFNMLKVVIGTVVSYFVKFNEKYNVKIIGNLPLGYDSRNFVII